MIRVASTVAVAVLALVTSSTSAASPGDSGDPGVFIAGVVSQIVHNDYAQAWRTLHPAHKRAAPLEEYVRCEMLSPILGELQSISVLGVAERRVQVVPRAQPVPATTVTVRIVLYEPSLDETTEVTHTAHAVRVVGRWAWILPRARYRLYRSGQCA